MVLGFPKASICRTPRHWASSLFALLPDSSSFGRLLMSGGTAARPLSLSFIGIEAAARSGVYVMSNPRILVVEDEAAVALDIREKLRRLDYEVAGLASSGQEAVAQAAERHPDLVLMDITLRGEMDGVEAADRIQKYLQIPVIYLTAHSDARTLVRAKLTEPYGYILKPFEETELRISIEMGLHKHKSSSERSQLDKAVLQDLLDRALRDSLTGLYNRRYLEEELPREVSLARRTGTAFSLIMLDVDHFKSINDQFGHGAGDTVLAHLANLLVSLSRTA